MSSHDPTSPAPQCIVVSCTCPDQETAERIADILMDQRLAACVQTYPITSQYRWEREVHLDQEIMLTIKTTAERYPALESAIAEVHPYEVPEVVAVPIVMGSQAYLDWVVAGSSEADRP